jgi:hypothetical protein
MTWGHVLTCRQCGKRTPDVTGLCRLCRALQDVAPPSAGHGTPGGATSTSANTGDRTGRC